VVIASVAGDVASQLSEMIEARGVTVSIDEDLPVLRADAGRIELVLMNLIANAVKYSDPNKAERLVRVERDRTKLHPVVIVRDNGIGIPLTKLPSIFDEFVRVHEHRDTELGAQGMGLGLSIVRECMDAMDASVMVESHEGVGTTFSLSWPSASFPRKSEE
jgi:signal transduction histidine kinase